MELLERISDIIIIIGAVAGALITIYKFLSGPSTFFQKIHQKKVKKEVTEALKEVLPETINSLSDKVKEDVLSEVQASLSNIEQLNITQNQLLAVLNNSLKDVLRERIMTIYNTYKRSKRLPLQKKEILDELYRDYKEQKGNTYIDKYKARMDTWKVVDNDIFDELED